MNHIIRPARPADATAVLKHMKRCVASYHDKLMTDKDEWTATEQTEEDLIINLGAHDLFLVAEAEGEIIGTLTMFQSKRSKSRHTASFGMAVQEGWTHLGIGKKLIQYMLDFAENSSVLTKIELEVFSTNTQAVSLYQKYGFKEEGRLSGHVQIDGMFVDLVLMGRHLN